ncbi:hypothetical protein Rsub_13212 [Raphidocelis subcapitata]|uniref:O-fucosyltransferase family protein n=1 Tax=Raphidocelis subcapitata TaxID=307507 RepID=A0A2V0PSZ0_9CHLO|nr:hypothetical protein Rsub_13212 [Raphidocelis subcapitata]|eukprot:GBG00466.1 hypothetical protein Rsub_13212 [Raphidocelis subcapitata]
MKMLALAHGFKALGRGGVTLQVLPVSYTRAKSNILWFEERPLSDLLDMAGYSAYWAERGINVTDAADTAGCPVFECVVRKRASVPMSAHTARPPGMTWHPLLDRTTLGTAAAIEAYIDAQLKGLEAEGGAAAAAAAAAGGVEPAIVPLVVPEGDWGRRRPDGESWAAGGGSGCVVFNMEWPVYIATDWAERSPPAQLLKGFSFPDPILAAAAAVHSALLARLAGPGRAFHALHLRIEDDWRQREAGVAGRRVDDVDLVARFIACMRRADFTPQSAVYAASGIFQTMELKQLSELTQRFHSAGVLGALYHKEALVEPYVLQGLSMEQLALVDLLVIKEAALLVGDKNSTFSEVAVYMREGDGRGPETFHYVLPEF